MENLITHTDQYRSATTFETPLEECPHEMVNESNPSEQGLDHDESIKGESTPEDKLQSQEDDDSIN